MIREVILTSVVGIFQHSGGQEEQRFGRFYNTLDAGDRTRIFPKPLTKLTSKRLQLITSLYSIKTVKPQP